MPDDLYSTAFWFALFLAAVLGVFLLTYIDRLKQARYAIREQAFVIAVLRKDRTAKPQITPSRAAASGLARVK
jgi:hypothetical protein